MSRPAFVPARSARTHPSPGRDFRQCHHFIRGAFHRGRGKRTGPTRWAHRAYSILVSHPQPHFMHPMPSHQLITSYIHRRIKPHHGMRHSSSRRQHAADPGAHTGHFRQYSHGPDIATIAVGPARRVFFRVPGPRILVALRFTSRKPSWIIRRGRRQGPLLLFHVNGYLQLKTSAGDNNPP